MEVYLLGVDAMTVLGVFTLFTVVKKTQTTWSTFQIYGHIRNTYVLFSGWYLSLRSFSLCDFVPPNLRQCSECICHVQIQKNTRRVTLSSSWKNWRVDRIGFYFLPVGTLSGMPWSESNSHKRKRRTWSGMCDQVTRLHEVAERHPHKLNNVLYLSVSFVSLFFSHKWKRFICFKDKQNNVPVLESWDWRWVRQCKNIILFAVTNSKAN